MSTRFRLSLTPDDAAVIASYLTSPEVAGAAGQPLAVRRFIVKLAEFQEKTETGQLTPVAVSAATGKSTFSMQELELIEAIKLEHQLGTSVGSQSIAAKHNLDHFHYLELVQANKV